MGPWDPVPTTPLSVVTAAAKCSGDMMGRSINRVSNVVLKLNYDKSSKNRQSADASDNVMVAVCF